MALLQFLFAAWFLQILEPMLLLLIRWALMFRLSTRGNQTIFSIKIWIRIAEKPNSRTKDESWKVDEGIWFEKIWRYKKGLQLFWSFPELNKDFQVRDLCRTSDVLLDPYRPGTLEKMGLDPLSLWNDNKGLIICRISGYGQTGRMSQEAGHDINYVAMSGNLFSEHVYHNA